MSNPYEYGYPQGECHDCDNLGNGIEGSSVEPDSKKKPDGKKIMFIGQDPTIKKKSERVKKVLMLDQENGQIRRWLENEVFDKTSMNDLNYYATNVVKCVFDELPSSKKGGAVKYLSKYFENCKRHLITEIKSYQPNIVLTFGEPAHILFRKIIEYVDGEPKGNERMQGAYTGEFLSVKVKGTHNDTQFKYSPCLHIQTYRVADKYGQKVNNFKEGLKEILKVNKALSSKK